MERLIVKSITPKLTKEGKTYHTIAFTDDRKVNVFDSVYATWGVGSEVEVELEQQGKYLNLVSGYVVAPSKDVSPMGKEDWNEKDARQRLSIEGQVCLKEVGECMRGGIDLPIDIMDTYTRILRDRLTAFENGFNSGEAALGTDAQIKTTQQALSETGWGVTDAAGWLTQHVHRECGKTAAQLKSFVENMTGDEHNYVQDQLRQRIRVKA